MNFIKSLNTLSVHQRRKTVRIQVKLREVSKTVKDSSPSEYPSNHATSHQIGFAQK
jgi:hypothetical protein